MSNENIFSFIIWKRNTFNDLSSSNILIKTLAKRISYEVKYK